jgi:hypothetical protein
LAGGRPKSADLRKDPASLAGEAEGKIRLEGVPGRKPIAFAAQVKEFGTNGWYTHEQREL